MNESASPPPRLRAATSWQLTQTATRVGRRMAAVFASEGAHQHHFAMLSALEAEGPCSQADLGRAVGLDRKDIANRVAELVDQELVIRQTTTQDPRRNTVALTPAGRRRLQRLDEAVTAAQADIFAALSTTERDRLHALLDTVRVDLNARTES